MKGKTEIEMYHGEGSFVKVYPRDVSRHHPEGKINIVVYTKPSMIKFSNNASSVERIVSSEEIEPLLIKDITIKSKKKEWTMIDFSSLYFLFGRTWKIIKENHLVIINLR